MITIPTLKEVKKNPVALLTTYYAHEQAGTNQVWTSTLGDDQTVATCSMDCHNQITAPAKQPNHHSALVAPLITDPVAVGASLLSEAHGPYHLMLDNQKVYFPKDPVFNQRILQFLKHEVNSLAPSEFRKLNKVAKIALPQMVQGSRMTNQIVDCYHFEGKNYVQINRGQWYSMEPVWAEMTEQGQIQCQALFASSYTRNFYPQQALALLPADKVRKHYDLVNTNADGAVPNTNYALKAPLPEFSVDFDPMNTTLGRYLDDDMLFVLGITTVLNHVEEILQANAEQQALVQQQQEQAESLRKLRTINFNRFNKNPDQDLTPEK